MIIKNKSNFIKHIGAITLNIGPNEISEADWAKEKEHPFVKVWLEEKELEIAEGSIKDITKLNVNDAIEVVEYTFDSKLLEEFKEKESRKTVLEAIQKQLEELAGKADNGSTGEV